MDQYYRSERDHRHPTIIIIILQIWFGTDLFLNSILPWLLLQNLTTIYNFCRITVKYTGTKKSFIIWTARLRVTFEVPVWRRHSIPYQKKKKKKDDVCEENVWTFKNKWEKILNSSFPVKTRKLSKVYFLFSSLKMAKVQSCLRRQNV